MSAFQRGWSHDWAGHDQPGYYIGQDHAPFTEAKGGRFTGYLDCANMPASNIVVEHQWREGDEEKSFVSCGTDEYEINCDEPPAGHVMAIRARTQPRSD